jgi:hypothetical protein
VHHVLDGYLPFPAVVVDRYGDLVASNRAFDLLTADLPVSSNLYRLALHPSGLAPRIRNLSEWSGHLLERLRHESRRHADQRLTALVAELDGGLPPARRPAAAEPHAFAVPLLLDSAQGLLRLITAVTRFTRAIDITIAELKMEAFLPADAATAGALRVLCGSPED